jgi:hypothetical protein
VLDDKGFFARALALFTDEKMIDRLQGHLMVLVNRVMAADQVSPSDMANAAKSLERTIGYLGIGLEHLAKGELGRAQRALETVALERILRVGVSLTLQLQKVARFLRQRELPHAPHLLFDPPHDALVAALLEPRPRFALDGTPRPFRTLAEVSRAAAALEEAAATSLIVFGGLGIADAAARIASSAAPEEARHGTLVRTLAAHLVLGQPPSLQPLSPAAAAQLGRATAEEREAAWQQLLDQAIARGLKYPQLAPCFAAWKPPLERPSDAGAILRRLMR